MPIVQRVFPGASQRCWVSKFLQWKNLTSELQRKERFIYQWERGFTLTTHTVTKKHTNKHLWEYNRDILLVLSCYNDSWGHGLHHYPKGLIFDTCNCKTQPSPPSERSHLYRCVSTRFFLHLTVLHPRTSPPTHLYSLFSLHLFMTFSSSLCPVTDKMNTQQRFGKRIMSCLNVFHFVVENFTPNHFHILFPAAAVVVLFFMMLSSLMDELNINMRQAITVDIYITI